MKGSDNILICVMFVLFCGGMLFRYRALKCGV